MKFLGRVIGHIDGGLERYFSKKWHWAITIPAVLLTLFAAYFIFCFSTEKYTTTGFRSSGANIAALVVGILIIAVMVLYFVLEIVHSRLTGRKTAWVFIVIASVCLCLWGFQHALNLSHHHDSSALSGGGHWSIIYDIYATGEIPPVNLYNQYYQPKLYHWIIAMLMRFNDAFINIGDKLVATNQAQAKAYPLYTISAYHALELTRVFMIALGILSFYSIYRIFLGLGLSDKKVGLATAITVLIPEFWFIQFFMNNDGLACSLALFALALALEFKRKEHIVPLLGSAVSLGLAMMAKLNSAFIAVPMAFIFLYVLVKKIRENKESKKAILTLVGKFALFAVIVFPLGLWTPISYKIQYGMPIGYVLDLTPTQQDKENYGMFIDPTFYNFFERCFPYPSSDLFTSAFNYRWRHKVNGVYINEYGVIDYNCWTAFFKTGFFDEWDDFFANQGYLAGGLLVAGMYIEALLAYVSIIIFLGYAFIYIRDRLWRQNFFAPATLVILAGTMAIDYVYFVNRYPVGCSQNARYIMPMFIPIQGFIATWICDLTDRLKRVHAENSSAQAD